MTTSNILSQLGSPGVSTGFKNRIINGAMVIDQRNAGASVSASSTSNFTYSLDRWSYNVSQASKFTIQQNAGSVTPPAGFKNYLGITSTAATSLGANDYYGLMQFIEGYNVADLGFGTVNAKTVTLSFWVYSSLTGNFGGSLQNSGQNRNYPFSYSIPVANTWTPISVTVAGDTTGTWLSTNGVGLGVYFGLGVGTTYGSGTANAWSSSLLVVPTGSVSVVGTSGATFYITGVQLEVGTTATNFDYRSYGTELALCQRYYYQSSPAGVSGVSYGALLVGGMESTTGAAVSSILPATMRTAPSITLTGTSFYSFGVGGITQSNFSVTTNRSTSTNAGAVITLTGTSGTGGYAAYVYNGASNSTAAFSAEL